MPTLAMDKNHTLWARGTLAGALATLAMSIVMLLSKKAHVMRRDYPPRKITRKFLRTVTKEPEKETLNLLSTANHFGYGMAAGVLYSLWRNYQGNLPPALHGIGYGILVWAVSYLGWVPALEILPPPADDQKGRVFTMIAAHIVYGGVLGACEEKLRPKSFPLASAPRYYCEHSA